MSTNENRNEVSFEIIKNVGILSVHPTGWNKEINIISWNEMPAKLDIRDWSPDHTMMSRGVTLTRLEGQRLVGALSRTGALEDLEKINIERSNK